MSFSSSGIMDDEMSLAKKLYYRQLEENGTYTKIVQELICGGGRV
jgi:hypothetical protein